MQELARVLPRITHIPTLLIWGERDRAVAPASAEPLSRVFQDAKVVQIAGAGHLPYEEEPEEFNRAVLEFLRT
jgi:pimeloyl-ACP methyl ester carboxylesterase